MFFDDRSSDNMFWTIFSFFFFSFSLMQIAALVTNKVILITIETTKIIEVTTRIKMIIVLMIETTNAFAKEISLLFSFAFDCLNAFEFFFFWIIFVFWIILLFLAFDFFRNEFSQCCDEKSSTIELDHFSSFAQNDNFHKMKSV